ncbi:hypothetical protein PENTCL1PPCAC_661, partial [Pristionchus entomophagus]
FRVKSDDNGVSLSKRFFRQKMRNIQKEADAEKLEEIASQVSTSCLIAMRTKIVLSQNLGSHAPLLTI